jgi:hypothetical protein
MLDAAVSKPPFDIEWLAREGSKKIRLERD